MNPFGYVATDGHRFWLNPKDCRHENYDVCATCDFDGYYASKYESVPWRADDNSHAECYDPKCDHEL